MAMVAERPVPIGSDRLFFSGMALAIALTAFAGFAPSYYLRSHDLPALSPLLQFHGFVFTSWIVLFVTQTTLIAAHRTDIHRRLGMVGAVLAATMVVVGSVAVIDGLRRHGSGSAFGMDLRVAPSIGFGSMLIFAILVTAGIVFRRRPDTHKRLMLLATITLMAPPIGRLILAMHQVPTPAVLFGSTGVFVAALAVYDFWARGRVHPAVIWGAFLLLVLRPLLVFAAATSTTWIAFADWLGG